VRGLLFDPKPDEEFSLSIDGQEERFRAVANPNANDFVHAMEGAKGTVYRIRSLESDGHDRALKVMKPKYRRSELGQICNNLAELKSIPGLKVCERQCLSPSYAPDVIEQYRNLQYAILMPWIQELSWLDILLLERDKPSLLEVRGSLRLACNLAAVLFTLELLGIAHCDLSASNVMVACDPDKLQIELIDVEYIYVPGFQQPIYRPLGTPGYQHRVSAKGHWGSISDRFAGAIILAEMLGWHDEEVRNISFGESYFAPAELQTNECRRFNVLADVIARHDDCLAALLERAWKSAQLYECPSLDEWNQTLNRAWLTNR
jgi:hypothetical protein